MSKTKNIFIEKVLGFVSILFCLTLIMVGVASFYAQNAGADNGEVGTKNDTLNVTLVDGGQKGLAVSVRLDKMHQTGDHGNTKGATATLQIIGPSGNVAHSGVIPGSGMSYLITEDLGSPSKGILPNALYKVSVLYTYPEAPKTWLLRYEQVKTSDFKIVAVTIPGCPGGPAGPGVPGTVCPDGTVIGGAPATPSPSSGSKPQAQLNCEKDGGRYISKSNCDYTQAKANCASAKGKWNDGAAPGNKCQYDSTPFAKIEVSAKGQSKDVLAVSWQAVAGVNEYSVKWQQRDKATVYGGLSVNFATNVKISGLRSATSYTVTVTAKKSGESAGYGTTIGTTLNDPAVQCVNTGGVVKGDDCDYSKRDACKAKGKTYEKVFKGKDVDNSEIWEWSCTDSQKKACEMDTGSGVGEWKEYHDSMGGKSVISWSCDYSKAKANCAKDSNKKWDDNTHKCDENVAGVTGSCGKDGKAGGSFFGLPTWYKYLKMDDNCEPKFCVLANEDSGGDCKQSSVPLVILALIEIVLRIGSIIAVVFVVIGGVKFVTSQGEPEGVKSARSTIVNALIGLVITLVATPIVGFIGNTLGG